MIDLTRLCDACGKMIGGSFKYCFKCQIYFCSVCWFTILQCTVMLSCSMCGGKLFRLGFVEFGVKDCEVVSACVVEHSGNLAHFPMS